MQNELASCLLKIERAKEHFATLGAEIRSWAKKEPPPLKIVKESDNTGSEYRVFVEVVDPPPLDRWALISGDCVHNLRSALDSLLYGIAIYETGLNPPADEKIIQFPIVSLAEKFAGQKYRIASLSPTVQEAIEKCQPYNVRHSELPPQLELLSSLNNQDKHRTLNVVAAAPHSSSIELVHPSPDSRVSTITVYQTIIVGKTKIASFAMEPATPNLEYKCVAVFPICIVHKPGPSKSPFSELANVLNTLIGEVERIATELPTVAVAHVPSAAATA